MKPIKLLIIAFAGIVGTGFMLSSCEKTFDSKFATESSLSNTATVQVYMAMVNANRNYVYVDSKPVNGSSLTSGSVFAGAPGFSVPGGVTAFLVRDTSSTATQMPLSFAENLQANAIYTVFVYDTITSPKQKTVTTIIEKPVDTTARLRFANFVYNPTLPPAVDIYSARLKANMFSNVNLTDVTNFVTIPSNTTDTFYVRVAGTGTNLQNYVPAVPPAIGGTLVDMRAIFTASAKRSYTMVFRGGYRTAITTVPPGFTVATPTLRTLSIFTNY